MTQETSLSKQVIESIKWVVIGKALTQLIRWSITFWVIRLLTPEDYGIVAMADVLFAFTALVVGSLITPSIIQAKNLDEAILRKLFAALIVVYTGAFLFQISIAHLAGEYYESRDVERILYVNAFCFFLMLLKAIPLALLSRDMAFKKTSVIAAVSNSCAALSTLFFAMAGYGFWSIVWGEIVFSVLQCLLVLAVNPVFPKPDFNIRAAIPMFKFGGLVTLHSLLFYCFLHLDIVIAGRVLSAYEVGVFAVAIQFALFAQKKLLPLLNQVSFPAFAKIQDDRKRVSYYVLKAQRLSFATTIAVFWGLALTIDLIIPIVVGEKWSGAILPAQLMLSIMPFRFSEELFNPIVRALGKAGHLLANVFIDIAVLGLFILLFVDKGSVGIALGWFFAYPIIFLIVSFRNCKIMHLPYIDLVRVMVRPIACGGIMASVVLSLRQFAQVAPSLELCMSIAVGGFTYLFATYLIDRSLVKELRALVKQL